MNTRPVFFDEFSLLNRYRAGYAPGDKVRGFFHLLRFRGSEGEAGDEAPALARPRKHGARDAPREPAILRQAASTEAISVRPIILQFQSEGSALRALPADRAHVEVIATEEEDDEFRVTVWGLESYIDSDCRILLMSTETIGRLCEAVPGGLLAGVKPHDDAALLERILQDEPLKQNEPLARRLSAVADINAQIDEHGAIKARIPIPKGSPPWNKDCRVVIVIDRPPNQS